MPCGYTFGVSGYTTNILFLVFDGGFNLIYCFFKVKLSFAYQSTTDCGGFWGAILIIFRYLHLYSAGRRFILVHFTAGTLQTFALSNTISFAPLLLLSDAKCKKRKFFVGHNLEITKGSLPVTKLLNWVTEKGE